MSLTPCASSARDVFEHLSGTESNSRDGVGPGVDAVSLEDQRLTPYHAKYFAWELKKRCAPGDLHTLAASLLDAQVDINPHQIDAALFAFRSPLSKGAILADEVGLGKTIEAGIVLSQRWAAGKRKLLVIVPANLRKQWHQELAEKFFLPAVILESRSFNEQLEKSGQANPFDNDRSIVVCSYQFARAKEQFIQRVPWDLVVLDEAHRLRNVYKPGNRIANAIRNAVQAAPKLLLTATPLQNSLLELFGLVSFIDEFVFGDLRSFKSRFADLSKPEVVTELKARLEPICQRTLRRQVLEYVPFTRRFALVQEFYPSVEERRLYELVSQYLQRPELLALPSGQRTLMTLVLRKLLASSTHAIAGTLTALVCRLERIVKNESSENLEMMTTEIDFFEELKEEWNGNEAPAAENTEMTAPPNPDGLLEELKFLRELRDLASSIRTNSKGDVLLTALGRGFAEAMQRGAAKKAVIFTESTRTQRYVSELLEASAYAGKVVLFNGSNNDEKSKSIYRAWLQKHKDSDHVTGSASADMRAALVEYFRDEGEVLIATEAAAEGINLQFCSLVVNYDLPWNPQRIEQRIGRCHRYGQKSDVVVVNFLNKENAADQRVYQLLDEKFKLFNGVFGSSDEVLGTIESGLDFEKRIAAIYERCRTPAEIEADFKLLQVEMETQIDARLSDTRASLLEQLDDEVVHKLRLQQEDNKVQLAKFETWLWLITKFHLSGSAALESLDERTKAFALKQNPLRDDDIPLGKYQIGRACDSAHCYRLAHPLARHIIDSCKSLPTTTAKMVFGYVASGKRIELLEPLRGQSGWLQLVLLSLESNSPQDHLVFAAITDDGGPVTEDQCRRMFSLPAVVEELTGDEDLDQEGQLGGIFNSRKQLILGETTKRNEKVLIAEQAKYKAWARERGYLTKEREQLGAIEQQIATTEEEAKRANNLRDKLRLSQERRHFEKQREVVWKSFDAAVKQLVAEAKDMSSRSAAKLEFRCQEQELFTVRWKIV